MPRLISAEVSPAPTVTDALLDVCLAGVREVGGTDEARTAYRRQLVAACAERVEAYTDSLWWPALDGDGNEVVRRSTETVEYDRDDDLTRQPWLLSYPQTRGVTGVSVEVWDYGTAAWTAAEHQVRPPAHWRADDLMLPALVQVVADVRPPAPSETVNEGLARLFGWLDQHRPVWSQTDAGPPTMLDAALQRSGASGVLRGVRTIAI